MKRILATAAIVASLLSGCNAPYSAGAPSVFNKAPTSTPSEASPSPASETYTAAPEYTAAAAREPVEPARQSAPPAAKTEFEIFDEVMFETISANYAALGVPLDKPAFDRLVNHICSDMRQGGAGYFTTGDVTALSEPQRQSLARSTWLVMNTSCYPKDHRWSEADLKDTASFMADVMPELIRRHKAAGLSFSPPALEPTKQEYVDPGSTDYGSGSTSGTGNHVSGSYGSPGSGYPVQCNDGSFSSSGGKRGACSWHGGVSD